MARNNLVMDIGKLHTFEREILEGGGRGILKMTNGTVYLKDLCASPTLKSVFFEVTIHDLSNVSGQRKTLTKLFFYGLFSLGAFRILKQKRLIHYNPIF